MVNVLVADNQDLTREGIKALLSPITNINVAGEAYSATDLEKLIIKFMPEVIIIENNYRGDFSIAYIKNLSATYPASNLLLLIGSQNREEILERISQWEINYLFKECRSEDLINAVYATAEGKSFLNNDFATDQLAASITKPALSVREKEIVQLISAGMTNKDIADTLFLSIHTIKTHRKNIIKKLGFSFKNAAELVLLIGYLNDFFI